MKKADIITAILALSIFENAGFTAEKLDALTAENLKSILNAGTAAEKSAELADENAKLTERIAELVSANEELEQTSTDAAPAGSGFGTVTYKGDKYIITVKQFRRNKRIITAEELMKNPEWVAKLIEVNSGILRKVEA